MCFKRYIPGAILSALMCLMSCTSSIYVPDETHTSETVSLSDLKTGRRLYVDNCSGCHLLVLPSKYTAPEWKDWMVDMRPQTNLNEQEEKYILQYLTVGSKNAE